MSEVELEEVRKAVDDFNSGIDALKKAADEARERYAGDPRHQDGKAPMATAQLLSGIGFTEPSPEETARRAASIELEAARRLRQKIAKGLSEIPEAYRFARFGKDERWLQQGVFARRPGAVQKSRAVGLATERARSVAWCGEAGTGKSSLAAATLALYIEHHPDDSVMFLSSYKLARARTLLPLGTGEAPLVERASEVELLVLDDLGSESHASLSAVPDVIHDRHERALPTWVTTWCTADELGARYGNGISRRLLERALVITFADG